MVQVSAGYVLGASGLVTGDEMTHFGEGVHYHQYGIKTYREWEARDEYMETSCQGCWGNASGLRSPKGE